MHLEKPSVAPFLHDPKLRGYEVLRKIFFELPKRSQVKKLRKIPPMDPADPTE